MIDGRFLRRITPALAAAIVVVVAIAVVACSDDEPPPTEPDPLLEGTEVERIEASALAALQALIDRDVDSLGGLLSPALREATDAQEIQDLAACIPLGVQLAPVDGDVTAFGEDATAFIYLERVGEPEPNDVDFQFDLVREETGRWSLVVLPACPFDG